MTKSNNYQTLNPDFPKKAISVFLFLGSSPHSLFLHPMTPIYNNLAEFKNSIPQTLKNINDKTIKATEYALIYDIDFSHLFPLKKKYWQKPIKKLSAMERMKAFVPIVNHYKFYYLLVTPSYYKNNTWYYQAALPILTNIEKNTIENVLLYSDLTVDPRAKNIAMYNIKEPKLYNWKSGQIVKNKDLLKQKLEKSN